MPLYEFACSKCQHVFEELVFGREEVHCPQCQTKEIERLISVPARPSSVESALPMQCKSEGPPCGAPWCKRS